MRGYWVRSLTFTGHQKHVIPRSQLCDCYVSLCVRACVCILGKLHNEKQLTYKYVYLNK